MQGYCSGSWIPTHLFILRSYVLSAKLLVDGEVFWMMCETGNGQKTTGHSTLGDPARFSQCRSIINSTKVRSHGTIPNAVVKWVCDVANMTSIKASSFRQTFCQIIGWHPLTGNFHFHNPLADPRGGGASGLITRNPSLVFKASVTCTTQTLMDLIHLSWCRDWVWTFCLVFERFELESGMDQGFLKKTPTPECGELEPILTFFIFWKTRWK